MTTPHDEQAEGIRVTDRRRLDPETLEVREPVVSEEDALVAEEAAGALLDSEVLGMEAKVGELTEDLRRVHAEYANYRKRVDRDRDLVRETAVGGVLGELLPLLDDIDRAREHGDLTGAFKAVGETLEATLSKIGLERFGTIDEAFDPAVHEALSSEAREGLDGPIVARVYQPGYRFAGRVLRPARVAVADGQ